MSKTFDNISEASATNYLFLFAQRTLGLRNEPPTPPPLNALGLPCEAMCLLWDWLRTENVQPKNITGQVYSELVEDAPTEKKALEEDASRRRRAERKALEKFLNLKTAAEKIPPLAGKITEYIHDHQDDAAQEDRWRTTMKRDMGKSFRIQHKAIDKQREEVQKVQEVQRSMQQRLDEVHSKVDEKLDRIVKELGRLTAV